jgi:hypothetical protein
MTADGSNLKVARDGFTSISNPLFLKGLENVKGTYETSSIKFAIEFVASQVKKK